MQRWCCSVGLGVRWIETGWKGHLMALYGYFLLFFRPGALWVVVVAGRTRRDDAGKPRRSVSESWANDLASGYGSGKVHRNLNLPLCKPLS